LPAAHRGRSASRPHMWYIGVFLFIQEYTAYIFPQPRGQREVGPDHQGSRPQRRL